MAKHELTMIGVDAARRFWEQQQEARIFLHPDVLQPMCERVDWWLATWNLEPVCLWPVCHHADGSHRPPELASYVGPLWHDTVARNRAHRWWTITRTVQQAFLDLLVQTYGSFEFELPPGSNDVRVLNWFRQENAGSVLLELDCRHTAVLSADPDGFPENALAGFGRGRRKDLGRTRHDAPVPHSSADYDQFCDLYERLLGAKSGAHVARRRRNELVALLQIADAGFGHVLAYRDPAGNVEGFSLSLLSGKTASLVVIATSEAARARGLSTRLRMEVLAVNSACGVNRFDFLGANSPLGAEEKHRYGARPEMYFRVSVSRR